MVNSKRAIEECLEAALGDKQRSDCLLIVIHASMGHNFQALLDETHRLVPHAKIVGASCCGIVGREGVSESMKDVAVMVITGQKDQLAVVSVDEIYGVNSYEKSVELANQLKEMNSTINMIYFLASGIDIANDRCIAGIESVFGPEVTIFGATSSDNMRGVASFQLIDDTVHEHAAYAVGFADPSLEVVTQATHGFVAVGEAMEVTRSEGHKIIELNGQPAWTEYTSQLGLPESATCGESIPIGALAEKLPDHLAEEYGNPHILRVVTKRDEQGAMYYATECPEGTRLWLTKRDEVRIFSELDKMMEQFVAQGNGIKPVAVFHADCLARGRYLFNRVLKDEIVSRMQGPLAPVDEIPPWLGMYGFGEFARLGGKNTYHNYSTSISAIYRK
ncbi:MAG: hypothetical protein GY801_20935 [bacterium]|nr:hypothetical protein [bacterium]